MPSPRPPFAPHPASCRCGGTTLACDPSSAEGIGTAAIRAAAERAAFGGEAGRRRVLKVLGAATVAAAMDRVFPILRAQEAWAEGAGGAPEKKDLKVGFIAITCATPIILAAPMGFYAKQRPERGRGAHRRLGGRARQGAERRIRRHPHAQPDAAGPDDGRRVQPAPFAVPAIENINGQAITLAMKHKDNRDPTKWKGMKFGIPFDYSMHNYLLRYYLAEAGLDPDKDVQLRVIPPPEMVANLRAENIDGFLGPDPFNQRAVYDGVGFIHLLTREMWDGHPCCAFGISQAMVTAGAEHLSGAAAGGRRQHRLSPTRPRTASRSPR